MVVPSDLRSQAGVAFIMFMGDNHLETSSKLHQCNFVSLAHPEARSKTSQSSKWLFFILLFTTYHQSNLAIENAEFPQPVLAGHFQRKILNIAADNNIKF